MFKRNDVDQDAVLDKVHRAVELLIHRESPYTGFFAPALEAIHVHEGDNSQYFDMRLKHVGWSAPMSFFHDKMEIHLNYNVLSNYNVECIANTIEHELWHFISNHNARRNDLGKELQREKLASKGKITFTRDRVSGRVTTRMEAAEKRDDQVFHGDYRKFVSGYEWGIACDLEVNSHSGLREKMDQCSEFIADITGKVFTNQFPDLYDLPSGLTAEQYYDILTNKRNPLYVLPHILVNIKRRNVISLYRDLLVRTYGMDNMREFEQMSFHPNPALALDANRGLDGRVFPKLHNKKADAVRKEVIARMFYSREVGDNIGDFAKKFVDLHYDS